MTRPAINFFMRHPGLSLSVAVFVLSVVRYHIWPNVFYSLESKLVMSFLCACAAGLAWYIAGGKDILK